MKRFGKSLVWMLCIAVSGAVFYRANVSKTFVDASSGFAFDIADRKFAARADVSVVTTRCFVWSTTDICIVGPIAIVPRKTPEADWDEAFHRQTIGGVWETKSGNLQPGNIYYVEVGKVPILISEIAAYGKKQKMIEGVSAHDGGEKLLSEMIGTAEAKLPLRVKLEALLK